MEDTRAAECVGEVPRSDDEEGPKHLLRVRTITGFIRLQAGDFSDCSSPSNGGVETKVEMCWDVLKRAKNTLTSKGYEVQTLRVATNSFDEWLNVTKDGFTASSSSQASPSPSQGDDSPPGGSARVKRSKTDTTTGGFLDRLRRLDDVLARCGVDMCSVGPSKSAEQTGAACARIVAASPRLSCSAEVTPGDVEAARAAADCMLRISRLTGDEEEEGAKGVGQRSGISGNGPDDASRLLRDGMGNFRFCAAANCSPFIPFFPAAKGCSETLPPLKEEKVAFALGLETGELGRELLSAAGSVGRVNIVFREGMAKALLPIEQLCKEVSRETGAIYVGIDSSLNPSLDDSGSVARAVEELVEVNCFGGTGTLAAAAAITTSLQSLPLTLTGYCSLMLPVCEDTRLSELAAETPPTLSIT